MSIRMIVLACDNHDCAGLVGITEPTSVNDARGTASAAFGWTKTEHLDHCSACSRERAPGIPSSSLMGFSHDDETDTHGPTQDPPRTLSDAS